MLAEVQNKRQSELEEVILQLSLKLLQEEGIRHSALRLLEIYKGDFRHSYSNFFPMILEISKTSNEYSLESLSENMESIRQYIEKDHILGNDEFKEIHDQIYKLCDHLNLEIGRWNYYSQYEQKIDDITSKTLATTKDLQKAEEKLKAASEQAGSIQTELIAVLSVFAAIVITFSGGFSIFGNIMASIGEAKHYEMVVLTAIICSLALFDTIFLLMYLVSKIIDRNIYAKCQTEDCSCENIRCSGITKIRRRLPYVFYFNAIGLFGILIDCIVWYLDVKGKLF